MTEEMNEEKKCNCFCHSEGFRDFLKIALGSFVGVFLALSLFAALHKPPCPMMGGCPLMYKYGFHQPNMRPMQRGDFRKFKVEKKEFNKEIPVRVEVETED